MIKRIVERIEIELPSIMTSLTNRDIHSSSNVFMVLVTLHFQAFVEMGSTDQAADIVTYYLSNPVMVKGGQVTFSVSSTFNFLQVHFYKMN